MVRAGILSRLLFVGLIALGLSHTASGTIIQIQLGGVDLVYNGSTVAHAGGQADPLSNATFFVDEVVVGVVTDDVSMGLGIPDVFNIPVAGGPVTSAAGGTLNLQLGGGDFLSLELDEAYVSYAQVFSTIHFFFAGAAATIDGQQLPFGVILGEPVSVSFSTQISQSTNDGTYVTSFRAAGTGEIQGIPEPATMALLAIGGLGLLRRRRA